MPAFLAFLVRTLVVWALFILVETAQGALRRAIYGVDVPMLVRQLSVGSGVLVIVGLAWLCSGFLRLRSQAAALGVGLIWVALTLLFEAVVGGLTGADWAVAAADYDPRRGGLMGLGLVAVAIAPWVVQRLRDHGPVDPPQGPRSADELQSPR